MLKVIYSIVGSILFVTFTYVLYRFALGKLKYYRLKDQIPFIKSDIKNPVGRFVMGSGPRFANVIKDPILLSKWREETKSDIVGFNGPDGPSVIVFDKELITHIGASKHTSDFEKTTQGKHVLRFLDKGILLQEGKEHAKVRKELLPIFNISNIKMMHPEFVKGAKKLVEKLKTVYPRNYPIVDDLQACTLDIISKVGFNYDMNSLDGSSEVSKAFEEVLVVVEFSKMLLLQFAFPAIANVISLFQTKEKKATKIIQTCIDDVIQKRIKDPKPHDDLLSKILETTEGKTDKDMLISLRQQLITFMAAGHETTSSGLSWAIYVLGTNKEVQEKLREEINTTLNGRDPTWDDIQSMKYLDNVFNEIFRMYSPVSLLTRQNNKPFIFKDILFPSGTNFMMLLQGRHMDKDNFENPEQFRPERWEEPQSDSFAFLPFWLGSRGCIGKNLAIAEFKTILVLLIQHLQLTVSPKLNVERIMRVTQKPSDLKVSIKSVVK